MNQETMKKEMNSSFANAVLMFAVLAMDKNKDARREEDYLIPMRTAITALNDGYTAEELADMMEALALTAKGMFGNTEVAA
jgi:hypothetical protein